MMRELPLAPQVDATVFVVDDNVDLSRLLVKVFAAAGLETATFHSGRAFLSAYSDDPGCLVLDVNMPEMCGLDVQNELLVRGAPLPVIMMTGLPDIPTVVRAFRQGAWDFVEKPVDLNALVHSTRAALAQDTRLRAERTRRAKAFELFAQLSPRESEVMEFVLIGRTNKQTAAALHLSPKTVETHRAHIMRKLEVTSLAELVQLSQFRSAPHFRTPRRAPDNGKTLMVSTGKP